MAKFTKEFREGMLDACYEFCMISFPIFIYIGLESLHRGDWTYIAESPEWSIATIFLSFSGISKFRSTINRIGAKLSNSKFGLLEFFNLIILLIAFLNSYLSFGEPTIACMTVKFVLFIIASFIFFSLVSTISQYNK